MFDHDYPLKAYFEEYKNQRKQELLNLMDFALDTRDENWFIELHERLERVI
jgi:uncharacterized protein YpiB (UPF0302 family)